jgi:hypothetical protein
MIGLPFWEKGAAIRTISVQRIVQSAVVPMTFRVCDGCHRLSPFLAIRNSFASSHLALTAKRPPGEECGSEDPGEWQKTCLVVLYGTRYDEDN